MAEKKVRRRYDNDYPSVTTILGVLRKIGLEWWFKNNTRAFCDGKSARGKLIGTQIHDAIEAYILKEEIAVETEYPEEVTNALKSFMLFKKENPEIELDLSEVMLTSEVHKYNGTLDCTAREKDLPLILDWKTGECKKKDAPAIYEEYKYQLSAYVKAYNEVNGTNIEDAIIISFAKDKVAYSMHRMGKEEIDDHFNEAFLPALKICNYQRRK